VDLKIRIQDLNYKSPAQAGLFYFTARNLTVKTGV